MIKTLRLTSVVAVILAAVVLASVLGFLRTDSFLPLRVGTGSDKQTQSILSGPSAVERSKTQSGAKPDVETTPPLIKQAELLAKIINPPEPAPEAGATSGIKNPPLPKIPVKPLAQVSSKFNLLGTCCSSNPRASYAYIRLPDNTVQWVGVGEQIGHLTIKEIRKDSVLCWDGKSEVPVDVEAIPETSSLLETGKASSVVSATKVEDSAPRPEPTTGTTPPAKASAAKSGNKAKAPGSAAKSAIVSSQPMMPVTPSPSAQITKQEQEKLSRLGDRLKNDAGTDSAGQVEAANRLINDFKSSTKSLPPGVKELGDTAETDPGPEPLKKTFRNEDRRSYYSGRLTPPRAPKQ